MNMKKKRIIKKVAAWAGGVLAMLLVVVICYVSYVAIQYYRIADNTSLDVISNQSQNVPMGDTLRVASYNLGFGAYSPNYSFFLDEGVMKDGTKTKGKYGKGISADDVMKNISGQAELAKSMCADFYFFQEVDQRADRSYKIDMVSTLRGCLGGGSTYSSNFHTAKLLYPFSDPIGKSESGIVTFSSYVIESAVRRSFPVTTNFINKLFDLDRCFSVHYLPIDGSDKKLVLINLHMSAYDEGGTIRAEQLEMLSSVLKSERDKGNYVIAGGDFNHCLVNCAENSDIISPSSLDNDGILNYFSSDSLPPDWIKNSILKSTELPEGFSIAADWSVPTCRGADIPYEEGVTYCTVVDGFIVSDNIEIVSEGTFSSGFEFSDHNPVFMDFRLK